MKRTTHSTPVLLDQRKGEGTRKKGADNQGVDSGTSSSNKASESPHPARKPMYLRDGSAPFDRWSRDIRCAFIERMVTGVKTACAQAGHPSKGEAYDLNDPWHKEAVVCQDTLHAMRLVNKAFKEVVEERLDELLNDLFLEEHLSPEAIRLLLYRSAIASLPLQGPSELREPPLVERLVKLLVPKMSDLKSVKMGLLLRAFMSYAVNAKQVYHPRQDPLMASVLHSAFLAQAIARNTSTSSAASNSEKASFNVFAAMPIEQDKLGLEEWGPLLTEHLIEATRQVLADEESPSAEGRFARHRVQMLCEQLGGKAENPLRLTELGWECGSRDVSKLLFGQRGKEPVASEVIDGALGFLWNYPYRLAGYLLQALDLLATHHRTEENRALIDTLVARVQAPIEVIEEMPS